MRPFLTTMLFSFLASCITTDLKDLKPDRGVIADAVVAETLSDLKDEERRENIALELNLYSDMSCLVSADGRGRVRDDSDTEKIGTVPGEPVQKLIEKVIDSRLDKINGHKGVSSSDAIRVRSARSVAVSVSEKRLEGESLIRYQELETALVAICDKIRKKPKYQLNDKMDPGEVIEKQALPDWMLEVEIHVKAKTPAGSNTWTVTYGSQFIKSTYYARTEENNFPKPSEAMWATTPMERAKFVRLLARAIKVSNIPSPGTDVQVGIFLKAPYSGHFYAKLDRTKSEIVGVPKAENEDIMKLLRDAARRHAEQSQADPWTGIF